MERSYSPAMNPENGPGRLFLERAKYVPIVTAEDRDALEGSADSRKLNEADRLAKEVLEEMIRSETIPSAE